MNTLNAASKKYVQPDMLIDTTLLYFARFCTDVIPMLIARISIYRLGGLSYMYFIEKSMLIRVLVPPLIVAIILVGLKGTFQFCLARYTLLSQKKGTSNARHFWRSFAYTHRAGVLRNVYVFKVFLWSILLIVPGIFARIRYSQAIYILAENPRKPVRECIEESKQMMRGRKKEYLAMNAANYGRHLVSCMVYVAVLIAVATSETPYVLSPGNVLYAMTAIFTNPLLIFSMIPMAATLSAIINNKTAWYLSHKDIPDARIQFMGQTDALERQRAGDWNAAASNE